MQINHTAVQIVLGQVHMSNTKVPLNELVPRLGPEHREFHRLSGHTISTETMMPLPSSQWDPIRVQRYLSLEKG